MNDQSEHKTEALIAIRAKVAMAIHAYKNGGPDKATWVEYLADMHKTAEDALKSGNQS